LKNESADRLLLSFFSLCPLPSSSAPFTVIAAYPLPSSLQPKAVSEAEDLELAALMAKVERENAEVSGDEDGSDDDE
jgi:hypothetical protein